MVIRVVMEITIIIVIVIVPVLIIVTVTVIGIVTVIVKLLPVVIFICNYEWAKGIWKILAIIDKV